MLFSTSTDILVCTDTGSDIVFLWHSHEAILFVCLNHRLLLTGACQGETPEAFAGRRKERDAARMAKRLEEFRKAQKAAGNMAAKQAAVRRKNAALIAAASSAAKGTKGSAQVPCPEKSVVCVADRVGAVAHKLPAKLAVSVSDVGGVSAKEDYSEGDGASLDDVLEATGREEEFHVLAGGDAPEVRRDAASDSMDTNSGGDVQNYTQTFKGLRSAYSAYSSVFASQVVILFSLAKEGGSDYWKKAYPAFVCYVKRPVRTPHHIFIRLITASQISGAVVPVTFLEPVRFTLTLTRWASKDERKSLLIDVFSMAGGVSTRRAYFPSAVNM